MNNPTQLEKYGNLNLLKINQRFANCIPAGILLAICGFDRAHDVRYIWKNTQNNKLIVQYIHDRLTSEFLNATPMSYNVSTSVEQAVLVRINEIRQYQIRMMKGGYDVPQSTQIVV